jgi:hypothetical protein
MGDFTQLVAGFGSIGRADKIEKNLVIARIPTLEYMGREQIVTEVPERMGHVGKPLV